MPDKDLKVLLVDDEIEITRSVSAYLEQSGFQVTTLNSGEKVVETVAQWHPDLVVLDIIMPAVDGVELCRRIRQLPSYTPIIMLTSK